MERNFSDILDEEIANNKGADSVTIVSNALAKFDTEYVKSFPVWMRCNYLARKMQNLSDEQINWDKVNEILSYQNEDLDFNDFDPVHSVEEFENVRSRAITAEVPEFNEPYYKKICKTCGDEFTLTKGEILFFQKKNFKIPSRCYCCRKNIEKPKPIIPEKKTEEVVVEKTQMQIALEKAGLC